MVSEIRLSPGLTHPPKLTSGLYEVYGTQQIAFKDSALSQCSDSITDRNTLKTQRKQKNISQKMKIHGEKSDNHLIIIPFVRI